PLPILKIVAGNALNHRKPMQPPTRQPATIARSYSPVMNVIPIYASSTIAAQPAASPSSPSVRLTALVVPATTREISTGHSTPSATLTSTNRRLIVSGTWAFLVATHHSPSEIAI